MCQDVFTSRGFPPWWVALLLSTSLLAGPLGCRGSKQRSIASVLAEAAHAAETRDAEALFEALDERSRHAMFATVKYRKASARLIRQHYPGQRRNAALGQLGDAARAADPPTLFALRCGTACLRAFNVALAAPARIEVQGRDAVVTTVRKTQVRVHQDGDGRWGLVWQPEELAKERTRASRDYVEIRRAAAVYARREQLGELSDERRRDTTESEQKR